MLTPSDLSSFEDVCTAISNEVADGIGFVSIRSLLSRFNTTLCLRPLLVEGMLASLEKPGNETSGESQWAILVDSETYKVVDRDIATEGPDQPLPSRFRNTVAHELVHVLAFRPSEFGVRLRSGLRGDAAQRAIVEAIEGETERLSPLLLWSEKSLHTLVQGRKEQLSVTDLSTVRQAMGISRPVLISRLRLLHPTSNLRNHAALMNIAIGIGEWSNDGQALLRSWPLYSNFDRSIVPLFLLKLLREDRLNVRDIFPDPTFVLSGRNQASLSIEVEAGLRAGSTVSRMLVECAAEKFARRSGSSFLFVVRKRLA